MQYRTLGKTGEKVSVMGLGTMRLPTVGGEYGKIDEPVAIEMIRKAIDAGVNYVDTAWFYHEGNSEVLCGKALDDGYREKVFLADKLAPWIVESIDDCERILDTQLERCRTDHFDFYLLHCLLKKNWPIVRELDLAKWLDKIQADGRVKHLGFSFHDDMDLFKEVIDYYPWTFCQIQYNFMNENHQAGTAGLKYAAEKGMGVVVMEPLLGGGIVNPPGLVKEMWDASPYEPVDLAFRWLYDKPEVSCVLSGVSAPEHVDQNLAIADKAAANSLSEEEHAFIASVVKKTEEITPIPCTRCNYCMPCPNGVNIPVNFAAWNLNAAYPGNAAHKTLHSMQSPEQQATNCTGCGICEEKCPQNIEIGKWMRTIADAWG